MKNTLLAIALASVSLAAIPLPSAKLLTTTTVRGGFFVNEAISVNPTWSKGLYDDSDTGYGANVGYRWALNPNVALGIEGGYTDLGKFDTKNAYNGLGLPNASVKGWTAGVNGHFNLTPEWYLSGRAGLFRADAQGAFATGSVDGSSPAYVSVSDTSTKYYAGAGFGYDFSNNFSVGLNYDYYKTDKNDLNIAPSLVSASAEYRF